MDIKLYESNEQLYIKLTGRVVLDECDRLKSTVMPNIHRGIKRICLDLSNVDFIDSAGLGTLVGMKVNANKVQAKLVILNPSKQVGDILMVSKLDSIFDVITGPDADQLVETLAKPENKVSAGEPSEQPKDRGPAMPSMPSAPSGESPASDPKGTIDQLCKQAFNHMRQGDYESAAQCYTKALEVDPEYLPAHNNLAIVYEKRPQWQQNAIDQWKKVLEISQRNNDEKHIQRAEKHLANLQRYST